MASWFTRALDRVTPWNRGGELQRRQERKKREEEQAQAQQNTTPQQSNSGLRVTTAQPTQRVVVDTPKPKQPENIFETLNKGLTFNKPNNALDITYRDWETDRKSTRLNSSHSAKSRMPSSA